MIRTAMTALMIAFASCAWGCEGSDCAGSLAYQSYGAVDAPRVLVVFLHGSKSSGGPADYMYGYARRFAQAHPQVVTVALLAPGYYDRNGKRSDGVDFRGTADDTIQVIEALKILRVKYHPQKILVLGHSRGAMNMAAILGKEPQLISGAVLVAGPYDMRRGVIDVLGLVGNMAKSTRIILVHGDYDNVVRLPQSTAFEEKARAAGLTTTLVVVPREGHDFGGLLANTAIEQLATLLD